VMSSAYGSSNLGVLGISRDKTGAMTLDETKLAAALASDSDAVAKVFVTGGFATAVATLADSYTTSGTGLFAAKTESLTNRSTTLQQQIDRITKNADMLRTRLEKQFGALEQAMSALQSQSQYLASFLK
jgi:flagellar hook-associated protein 2